MFYIGCHLSSAKGFLAMGKDAEKIGATTFQFFTRNPRGGSAKPLDHEDIAAFLKLKEELGLGTLVAHAPYTLNGCSADEKIRDFAKRTMADDLERMEAKSPPLLHYRVRACLTAPSALTISIRAMSLRCFKTKVKLSIRN